MAPFVDLLPVHATCKPCAGESMFDYASICHEAVSPSDPQLLPVVPQ